VKDLVTKELRYMVLRNFVEEAQISENRDKSGVSTLALNLWMLGKQML
jgi:hypothetical protein